MGFRIIRFEEKNGVCNFVLEQNINFTSSKKPLNTVANINTEYKSNKDVSVETIENISLDEIKVIDLLGGQIFPDWNLEKLENKITSLKENNLKMALHLCYLSREANPKKHIGFKFGYEKDDGSVFYSWLGGVLPEYRGYKASKLLMKSQHNWCKEMVFFQVETKCRLNKVQMMAVNLKSGFEFYGTEEGKHNKLIFRKKLN